jgi:two-component system LytT family response regulator
VTGSFVRALIVDDEPVARDYLRDLLLESKDIRVVGEAASGKEAVNAIRTKRPDLIFLDIQMPEMDGFEVLAHFEPASLPAIVFVTAYERYALQAFEANALDYLLKPFDRRRFQKAMDRALSLIRSRDLAAFEKRLKSLIGRLNEDRAPLKRIMVRSRDRAYFLKTDDIRFIEAAGNYAALHAGEGEHLIRETLRSLERRLDPDLFVRIHRSYIVNLDFVREVISLDKGDYRIVLTDGNHLRLGRCYRENLLARF